jgi:hypothetical protein
MGVVYVVGVVVAVVFDFFVVGVDFSFVVVEVALAALIKVSVVLSLSLVSWES